MTTLSSFYNFNEPRLRVCHVLHGALLVRRRWIKSKFDKRLRVLQGLTLCYVICCTVLYYTTLYDTTLDGRLLLVYSLISHYVHTVRTY